MFGINKNGTKHKVGIILPAFFPSSRVTYDNTQSGLTSTDVQDAIDELVQSGGGSIDIQRPTFTQASTRANIESGETISTLFGKIKKFFSDLKTVAFSGSYNDLSNKPTIPTDFVSKANGGTFGGNIVVDKQDGTTSSVGITEFIIGNNKGQGVDKNSRGFLYLFSNTGKYVRVRNDNGTANRNIYFPDKDGTVALTDDIHGIKDSVYVTAGNLDTYTTQGVYCVFLTSAVSPLMEGELYVLEVFAVRFSGNLSLGYVQRLNRVYPIAGAKIFQRAYYGASGGWSAWREI